jgi:organic hydroperoxide reductase OsmC/OhrA
MDKHYYNVNVAWSNERKGVMCSPELTKITKSDMGCIEVATPPEFPKGIPGIWSPEHLFTASVASCFMTTFLAIAENSKLKFSAFNCNAKGKLERVEGKLAMSEVELRPWVMLHDETDRERALRILDKTENSCLISNSIKTKVIMRPEVSVSSEFIET